MALDTKETNSRDNSVVGKEGSPTPSAWLQREYEVRRTRNPYYSQRAFSRLLGVSSGRLSEFLSGKRTVTVNVARRISGKLGFPPEQEQKWLATVESARAKRSRTRRLAAFTQDPAQPSQHRELSRDIFQSIADWYHYGILNLMRTSDFKSEPRWIARRLGITAPQVRAALGRLERLGLVTRENGEWSRSTAPLTSTHDVPSAALRQAHKQNLELAIGSLETIPVGERDITSITVAIDPARLPLAKRAIKNFRRGLAELLEDGEKREVYTLNVALFPLTKGRKSR